MTIPHTSPAQEAAELFNDLGPSHIGVWHCEYNMLTCGSREHPDAEAFEDVMAVIQMVTHCLLQSGRRVVVAVKKRTFSIASPVSSRTSRSAHDSNVSPCSRWPPGWATRPFSRQSPMRLNRMCDTYLLQCFPFSSRSRFGCLHHP